MEHADTTLSTSRFTNDQGVERRFVRCFLQHAADTGQHGTKHRDRGYRHQIVFTLVAGRFENVQKQSRKTVQNNLVEVGQTRLVRLNIKAHRRQFFRCRIFRKRGETCETAETRRPGRRHRWSPGIRSVRPAITLVDIRHDAPDFFLRKTGTVQRRSQLHQIAVAASVHKRVVRFETVDVIRQRRLYRLPRHMSGRSDS